MAPIQVLTNNLLYDFSQTAIPTDNVDEDYLLVLLRWDIGNGVADQVGRSFLIIKTFDAHRNCRSEMKRGASQLPLRASRGRAHYQSADRTPGQWRLGRA
jgi:hypothetical protein